MIKLEVFRYKASLQYKRYPERPAAWDNSDFHNSLDRFTLKDAESGVLLFECKAQTVANAQGLIDGVQFYDTIAAGPFRLRAFAEPRAFKCQPHGLCDCTTLRGDRIDIDSVTPTNKSRWLVHDWKNRHGVDTRVAWSAGCFVLPDAALERFGFILIAQGVQPGDFIDGILEEEAW
jgi:hypothetical protein